MAKRYKLWVSGEVECTCGLNKINNLLIAQGKNPLKFEKKVIYICDTITAIRIG